MCGLLHGDQHKDQCDLCVSATQAPKKGRLVRQDLGHTDLALMLAHAAIMIVKIVDSVVNITTAVYSHDHDHHDYCC